MFYTQPVGANVGQDLATQPVVHVYSGDSLDTESTLVVSVSAEGVDLHSEKTSIAAQNGVAAFSGLKAGRINANAVMKATAMSETVQSFSELFSVTQQSSKCVAPHYVTSTTPACVGGSVVNEDISCSWTCKPGYSVVSGTAGERFTCASDGGWGPNALVCSRDVSYRTTDVLKTILEFTDVPSNPDQNQVITVEVTIKKDNAVAKGADDVVTLSIASGSGSLVGTTKTQAVEGVATFSDVKINGNGQFTLQASVEFGTPFITAKSDSITVKRKFDMTSYILDTMIAQDSDAREAFAGYDATDLESGSPSTCGSDLTSVTLPASGTKDCYIAFKLVPSFLNPVYNGKVTFNSNGVVTDARYPGGAFDPSAFLQSQSAIVTSAGVAVSGTLLS